MSSCRRLLRSSQIRSDCFVILPAGLMKSWLENQMFVPRDLLTVHQSPPWGEAEIRAAVGEDGRSVE